MKQATTDFWAHLYNRRKTRTTSYEKNRAFIAAEKRHIAVLLSIWLFALFLIIYDPYLTQSGFGLILKGYFYIGVPLGLAELWVRFNNRNEN